MPRETISIKRLVPLGVCWHGFDQGAQGFVNRFRRGKDFGYILIQHDNQRSLFHRYCETIRSRSMVVELVFLDHLIGNLMGFGFLHFLQDELINSKSNPLAGLYSICIANFNEVFDFAQHRLQVW